MFNVYKQEVGFRARLRCQLASMLALLLLLHNVAGKETQKDVPTIEHITTCPDVGYYFKRDVIPNAIDPGPCKLCFCQDNSTAVCWLRDSKRCDPKRYSFIGRKKRENRNRRSPGFSDIFFRDAAREVFHRQTPEQCKPYESSYSEGCPPADWCIGCTVCDCDANGRWDCHTLSFCPDKNGKKQVKKKKKSLRSKIVKRQLAKKQTSPKTTKRPIKKPTRKSNKKPNIGKKPQKKQNKSKQNKNKVNKKGNTKKISQVKSKKPFQNKKVRPKIKGSKNRVQKGKKPITIKSNKSHRKQGRQGRKGKPLDHNETIQYTKMILKKVMASVNKVINESKKMFTKDKSVEKRSMTKHINNKNKQSQSKGVKKIRKWQPVKDVRSNRKQGRSRQKRQITNNNLDNFEKENIFNFLPKTDAVVFSASKKLNNELLSNERSIFNTSNKNKYFEYNIDSKYNTTNEEKPKYEKQIIKNSDLETNNAFNITRTESTDFKYHKNGTKTTSIPSLTDYKLKNTSLHKNSLNNTRFKKKKKCGQICQLKKAFKRLIGGIGRKKITSKDNKKNKSVMSHFRNFFRKLFQTNKKKNASDVKKKVYHKRNIIKSLCKNVSSCKFDPMDKTLQSKLDQLKIESNNILKSVRIIKGLLKLFGDRETSVIKNNSSIDNNQQNKDILILNAILKDNENLASSFTNLTETRLKQINYIRDNTKMFIKSIENFAFILNDIMDLLRNENKSGKSRRMLRCTKHHQNESIKNVTVGEKIQKLKNLLINYNLVQNRFMKGMFDVLVTLDQKTKPDNNKLAKVSDEIATYNESQVIDNYTKNILNNLRKLKNLVVKLSSKKRMKRAAMGDDDAIDYFLMLIEYLLKQNRPLDVPPVSDGIDLLIEAIKNSPDIRPIQKKVLDSIPIQAIKTDIITTERDLIPTYHDKIKNNESKISSKANNVIKVFESLDEDMEGTNMHESSNILHQKENSEKANNFTDDKSTLYNLDLETSTPSVYIAKENEKINIILDSFDGDKNDDKRGYEVFVDDTDEDEGNLITTTQSPEIDTEVDISVTQNIPERTFPPNINENNLKKSLNTLKAMKKTKLDWVEENFSREDDRREILDIKETTTQILKQRATRTLKSSVGKYSNPVSSISREIEDERQGKTMNPEYLMYKKQMNLLNSLDYGTEKSVPESESKEEKYNADSFPFM